MRRLFKSIWKYLSQLCANLIGQKLEVLNLRKKCLIFRRWWWCSRHGVYWKRCCLRSRREVDRFCCITFRKKINNENYKRTRYFLAQFLKWWAAFQWPEIYLSLGKRSWATQACNYRRGTPVVLISKKQPKVKLCDELKGLINECGLEITELSTHLQGQLVAVHPAYNELFDGFAPANVHGNAKEEPNGQLNNWNMQHRQVQNLGLNAMRTFTGALIWPMVYPWPQRPAGLVEEGFRELAKRWLPILDEFDKRGVDVCYEIHPGEDPAWWY